MFPSNSNSLRSQKRRRKRIVVERNESDDQTTHRHFNLTTESYKDKRRVTSVFVTPSLWMLCRHTPSTSTRSHARTPSRHGTRDGSGVCPRPESANEQPGPLFSHRDASSGRAQPSLPIIRVGQTWLDVHRSLALRCVHDHPRLRERDGQRQSTSRGL